MAAWKNPFRKTITRRFIGMMVMFLTLVLIGAVVVYWNNNREVQDYRETASMLENKQRLVAEITEHTNRVFFRVRGYYAFLNDYEYDQIFVEKKNLETAIAEFKKLQLDDKETQLIESLEQFFQKYYADTLPVFIKYAQANDYENLRKLSAQGVNEDVNNLLQYAQQFQLSSQKELELAKSSLDKSLSSQGIQFVLYVIVILIISIFVTYRTARSFGIPLSRLSSSAKMFAIGYAKQLDYTDREDEIGGLARSLESMMLQIQSKEEELLAQNEELLAQQDELQVQQEELTEAIVKMEDNEQNLQRRNRLVQSLASTLDKRELLQSIIKNMVDVMRADKGIIVLFNVNRSYAAFGLSEKGTEQFLASYGDGIINRIKESKEPYTISRPGTPGENGYHLEAASVNDIYIPVMNAGGEVIACIVMTRMEQAITRKEEEEAAMFAKQISLSLEKLELYEETEKQRQMTQDILNTIQEGIQLVDQKGATIQVNPKWREMMGWDREARFELALIEDFYANLIPLVKDAAPLTRFINDIIKGQADKEQSIIYEMSAPAHRYVQMFYEPLYRGGERLGTLLVHRDITKEYEVDQMKSDFVSTVSHELRTPLASVLGFTELLLYKELTPERQRKYLNTIHQEAQRLTLLINDFLDLQRMESGKQSYDFKLLNMAVLIDEVMEIHKVNTSIHQLEFINTMEDTQVKADSDKMKQVLMNVVGNAVKYSPHGGKVTVVSSLEEGKLRIDISDEGLGIPKDAQTKLFSKFYRVDNTDRREIGGTGLGLAIVKEIMEIHGGAVQVASVFGEGSTFTLWLPLAKVSYEAATSTQSSVKGSGTVYIVEDDASLSELLKEEVTSNGYTVVQFVSGEDAIKAMFSGGVPDAVVLDLVLEDGMNGWEVIERMKRDERLRNVPILISSAFEEKERAEELGAKGYLVKPYQPHKLSEALLQVFMNKDVQGQIYVPDLI